MLTGYKIYKSYVAIKLHFTSNHYDFFLKKGKTKTSFSTYEKRHDKLQFEKLISKNNVTNFILGNILVDPNMYIRDFKNENQTRLERYTSSFDYSFNEDLKKIHDIHDSLRFKNGQIDLLNMYMSNEINIETMTILNQMFNFIDDWKTKTNQVIYEDIFRIITKYYAFIDIDLNLYKQKVINKYMAQNA